MNSKFKVALWTLMLIYGGAVSFDGNGYVQAMNNRSNSLLDELKFHYNDKNVYRLNKIVNEKYLILKDIVLNNQITNETLQLVEVLIYIEDNLKQSEKVKNIIDMLINRCIDVIKDRIIDIYASNDDSTKKGKIKAAKQLPEYKILSSNYVRSENALQKKLTLKQRNVLSLVRLDNYTAFIAGRHFKNIDDYVNLELANKHFSGNITKYFYSPLESITPEELKFFPNIQTLYLNNQEDIERFLEYNPTNDFIKNLPEGHLKNNKGKFIAVEVHAPVDYDNAKMYLEKLNKLLVDWNLTEDATDQEKDTLRKKLIGHVKFLNVAVNWCEDIGHIDDKTGVFVFNDDIYTGNKWLGTDGEYYINKNKTYFIRTIEDCAFIENEELTSITIPNSVTSIGSSAFHSCSNLKHVVIPDSVSMIMSDTFSNCSKLENVKLPQFLRYIGTRVFCNCDQLKEIIIPASVTSIDYDFVCGLSQHTVVVPYTAMQSVLLYDEQDENSTKLEKKIIVKLNEAAGNCEYKVWWPDDGHLVIPGLNNKNFSLIPGYYGDSIYNRMFEGRTDLVDVTIGEGVKSIGDDAFSGCKQLKKVIIPKTVLSIGKDAFTHCINLTNIEMTDEVQYIGRCAFCHTNISEFVIPNSVTSINDGVFFGCANLKSITIHDNVASIGKGAFGKCVELTAVDLKKVAKIDSRAFEGCTKLESITISKDATKISQLAFSGCKALEKIFIKCYDGVISQEMATKIERMVKRNCKSIERIIFIDAELREITPTK